MALGEQLAKNAIDFAIIDASDVFEKLYPISTRPLTREPHVLVCRQNYRKANGAANFSFERYCEEKFVSHTSDALEIKFWSKHHFKNVPRTYGHLPERLVRDEVKAGTLKLWPTSTPKYENRIAIAIGIAIGIAIAQLSGKKPGKREKTIVTFISDYFVKNDLLVI